MAKLKFPLDQTMSDALQQTERAKQSSVQPSSEDVEIQNTASETVVPSEPKADESTSVEANRGENALGFSQVEEDKDESSDSLKNQETNNNEISRTNVRNVTLDDETLFRLDAVKKRMNKTRKKGEPRISVDYLLYISACEWLDKNHPETKELYKFLNP